MKTHELLDVAHLDPAAWILEAGVYLAKGCSEDKEDYLSCAFDDIIAESHGSKDACFMSEHTRDAVRKAIGTSLIDGRFASKGTCDHCGAWFKFGIVYRHTSGVACVVGHQCAEQSFAVENRFTLVLNRARKAAAAAALAAKMRDEAIVQATTEGFAWLYTEQHAERILTDIAAKGFKYGSLTFRQIELVKRIRSGEKSPGQIAFEARAAERAKRDEETARSTYQGEVGKPITVELEILATREHTFAQVWPPRTVTWHLMRDANGNVYTSRGVSVGVRGEFVKATWTVRDHEEYKGTRQTILGRPRKITVTKPEVSK